MGNNTKIQDTIKHSRKRYENGIYKSPHSNRKYAEIKLWQHVAFSSALENSHNAIKSVQVLKKHLPEKFHRHIKFSQPKTLWILTVKKGITATQLELLLDDLLVRIAKDISYAPRIKVTVNAGNWDNAGFPLHYPTTKDLPIPNSDEADKIITEFLNSANK